MTSVCRQECTAAVEDFARQLKDKKFNQLLYIGTAGDPDGGEYSPLFNAKLKLTLDADAKWKPDIVADIANYHNVRDVYEKYGTFDIVICTQVIEHIPYIWEVPENLCDLLEEDGYLIVDCPWSYPYHAEPPSFGDYWRISKDGMSVLFDKDFNLIDLKEGKQNTSCLYQKKS